MSYQLTVKFSYTVERLLTNTSPQRPLPHSGHLPTVATPHSGHLPAVTTSPQWPSPHSGHSTQWPPPPPHHSGHLPAVTTSSQWPPRHSGRPPHTGHLSTVVTYFRPSREICSYFNCQQWSTSPICPKGSHCREVRLYRLYFRMGAYPCVKF